MVLGKIEVIPFLKKHPRIIQLICDHCTASDIGTFTEWHGNTTLVRQCDVCGKIGIGEKPEWYPLPKG